MDNESGNEKIKVENPRTLRHWAGQSGEAETEKVEAGSPGKLRHTQIMILAVSIDVTHHITTASFPFAKTLPIIAIVSIAATLAIILTSPVLTFLA